MFDFIYTLKGLNTRLPHWTQIRKGCRNRCLVLNYLSRLSVVVFFFKSTYTIAFKSWYCKEEETIPGKKKLCKYKDNLYLSAAKRTTPRQTLNPYAKLKSGKIKSLIADVCAKLTTEGEEYCYPLAVNFSLRSFPIKLCILTYSSAISAESYFCLHGHVSLF